MLQLGAYQFSISTAAYQDLARSTQYRWAAQERHGQHDDLQFTGPGPDTITLSGVVYPDWRGGTTQPASMRELGATGVPHLLVDGLGVVHGLWVIEQVDERQAAFGAAGQPRKQEFTMKLRKAADVFPEDSDGSAELEAAAAVALASSEAMLDADSAQADLDALAGGAAAASGTLAATLAGALDGVNAVREHLGSMAASATGAVGRCLDACGGMQDAARRARSLLGSPPSLQNAAAAATALMGDASNVLALPSTAAVALKRTAEALKGANSPASAVSALRNAATHADQVTALARNTAASSARLLNRIPK